MIYPQNFEQKIGFDQIRSLIKEKCLSSLGTDYTDRMQFSTDYDAIRKQLNCTWEFVHIIEQADDFPADFFFDVRASLKRVRIEGTFLEESELFDKDVYEAIDLITCVKGRDVVGGPAPQAVKKHIEQIKNTVLKPIEEQ